MIKAPKLKKLKEPKGEFSSLPTLDFNEIQLPQVKDWKVGEEYMLMLKVRQTAIREVSYGENKGKITGSFEVVSIGVHEEK